MNCVILSFFVFFFVCVLVLIYDLFRIEINIFKRIIVINNMYMKVNVGLIN